jgi:hypothetical protein
VRNTNSSSGFQSSLDLLREEEERFIKADPSARAIHELGEMFAKASAFKNAEAERENARLAERCRGNERGARLDRDLAVLAKSFPAVQPAKVAAISARQAPASDGDLMAKAVGLLQHDATLNAEQRGRLLLGISARSFAKAARVDQHPVAARVDEIRTALEQAKQERDLGPASVYVDEALNQIAQGVVDADDRARLQHLLMQIKLALSAGDTDALGTGDAR